MADERYRQTDGRPMTYTEREHTNVNVVSFDKYADLLTYWFAKTTGGPNDDAIFVLDVGVA